MRIIAAIMVALALAGCGGSDDEDEAVHPRLELADAEHTEVRCVCEAPQ